MNKSQIVSALALPAAVGVVVPFVVPSDWLKYALGVGLVLALIGAALCLGNAERKDNGMWGVISFMTIGTSNPEAKVRDLGALVVFVASILYLAGLTIGAFAAV